MTQKPLTWLLAVALLFPLSLPAYSQQEPAAQQHAELAQQDQSTPAPEKKKS